MRRLALALAASMLALAAPTNAAPESAPCVGFTIVDGQGPSCPEAGGWRVLFADGSSALTHGPDYMATPEPDVAAAYAARSMPICVADPATQHHSRMLYVHPSDKASRYNVVIVELRDMVNRSNAFLRDNAAALGGQARYKFACDAPDLVTVDHVKVNVSSASDSFASIRTALRSQGYTSNVTKYWVWYDDSVGSGIAGQGEVHNDDRATAVNSNNRGGDFAMTYGYTGDFGVRVLMHENGHNLGAVQLSAPHSSGGWHCNDGRDTMCYDDGGSTSDYTETSCSVEKYDCGNDDYFHVDPPNGSYLATHWNMGSRLNKYFDFGDPPLRPPTFRYGYCIPDRVDVGTNVTCTWSTADDHFVSYTVDWDDGTTSEFDARDPYASVSGKHAWNEPGAYDVTVTATDIGTPALSATRLIRVDVGCPLKHTGRVLLGLQGEEIAKYTYADRAVPVGCGGHAYQLNGNGEQADFDVCWYADAQLLECHREGTDPSGIVPEGATLARIVLFMGVNANYDLHAVS